MVPSKLIALFFAFAMAAAALQPSEARIQGLKPSQEAEGEVLHPSTFSGLPGSAPSPPQPAECLTSLMGMFPCMDYLTNITVLAAPSTCCDGLKSVINDAPICLCHGMNGDMNSFMPRPIDPIRMMILPLTCGTMLPLQTLFSCNTQQVPPIMPSSPPMPPMTPASPPA